MRVARPRRRRATQSGFTLVELMVSLVMFSFAVAGILAVAVSMAKGFREQKMAIQADSAARGAMEYLSDALRGASPAVPTGDIVAIGSACPVAGSAYAISAPNTTSPDELTLVYANGSVATSLDAPFDITTTTMVVNDASQLEGGDTVLVSNFAKGHLAKILSKVGNTLTLDSPVCVAPAMTYPENAIVVRANRAKFFIQPLDGVPTLFIDPDAEGPAPSEPLAEGIEDMQIVVAADDNPADGVITEGGTGANDNEWYTDFAGEALPLGPIRAMRLTLVARATSPTSGAASYLPFPVDDHTPAAVADNFRRRILTSTIEIRNLQGSP